MSHPDEEKWQQRYHGANAATASPAQVLTRYQHLLPSHGNALDLAAGLGANALLLARHGLATQAWDLSSSAMQSLSQQAQREGLPLACAVRDVVARPPQPDAFDVIVVSRFLERRLCPAITAALRPGGLLFYQTFLRDKAEPALGPANPAYLLERNELLHLFGDLIVRAYHEEGKVGELRQGIRNEALLVAQRA